MPFYSLTECPEHMCNMPMKAAIYSVEGTDKVSLAFVFFYSKYYTLHYDWQRDRVMHILENSLKNPVRILRDDTKPFRDFAWMCVRTWRNGKKGGSRQGVPLPSREVLEAVAGDLEVPSTDQLEAMLCDLHRLGGRYLM